MKLRISLLAVALLFSALLLRAEPVSRDIPPFYTEKLQPLLTPIEEVLAFEDPELEEGEDGVVLLDERVHYVDESGRRWIVLHRVYKALTEAGVDSLAEDREFYRKTDQSITLVLARTIQPDGKRLPVKPNAAFLKSPQPDAASSLYSDVGELRIVFPNTKPGSVTEQITLIEEPEFRIPGEYSYLFVPASGWPRHLVRFVLDLPEAMAERLKTTRQGTAPEMVRETVEEERVRFTWLVRDQPAISYEVDRAPVTDRGPALWLTTLPDWASFVKWYQELLAERTSLTPELEALVDEWTADAESEEEIIRILLEKVASEVRYTGLEFGVAGFQPESCARVWENQYGDCKDKSNLLRAMLVHKGIKAHLALLDTNHVGRIEKRSPDYRHFNHAILAIEMEDGEMLFCDPTIERSTPGMLSPASGDRDVLLIKPGGEWTRTPPADPGLLAYEFDLDLRPSGELEGWFSFEATHYYGAWYAEMFLRLDKEEAIHRMRDVVSDFYPGAEVIDLETTPIEEWTGESYRLRAFMMVPGNGGDEEGNSLHFPHAGWFVPDLGPRKPRETPYFIWGDHVQVKLSVALPEGWKPIDYPGPYHLLSPVWKVEASWDFEEGECLAALDLKTLVRVVEPEAFEAFYNATISLEAWLNRPLVLTHDDGELAREKREPGNLRDFPIMPTGEGQLALLEKRFPEEGNRRLRREALARTAQYFPDDLSTLFQVEVYTALMDEEEGKKEAALKKIRRALKRYGEDVSRVESSWAEYLEANLLSELDRREEALAIMRRLAEEANLLEFRRAWSAIQAAELLGEEGADEAIALLEPALSWNTTARPYVYGAWAGHMVDQNRETELQAALEKLAGETPYDLGEIRERLVVEAGERLTGSEVASGERLLALLEATGLDEGLEEEIADLQAERALLGISGGIRESLLEKLETVSIPEWQDRRPEMEEESREAYREAIDEAVEEKDGVLALGLMLEAFDRFEPDDQFPYELWRAASFADYVERNEEEDLPVLEVLLDACDQLPRANDYYQDGRFTRASVLEREEEFEAAEKVYADLVTMPEFDEAFAVSGYSRWGRVLERLGRYEEALEAYGKLTEATWSGSAVDSLLRAAFLHLIEGEREEAMTFLKSLTQAEEDALAAALGEWQVRRFTQWVEEHPEQLRAWWEISEGWWQQWEKLEEKLGLEPVDPLTELPVILSPEEMGRQMGLALQNRDREAFWHAFRILMQGARWLPDLAIESSGMVPFSSRMAGGRMEEMRELGASMLADVPEGNRDVYARSQVLRAGHLCDIDRAGEAYALVEELREMDLAPEVRSAMLNMWSYAAIGADRDLEEATLALEEWLSSERAPGGYAENVMSLARLYREQGRFDAERELLAKALEHAAVDEGSQNYEMMEARLQALRENLEASTVFDETLAAWKEEWDLPWLAYAEPQSLEDRRCRNLEALLEDPDRVFEMPEVVKLRLLVAADPEQPFERRVDALQSALNRLSDLMPTREGAHAIFRRWIEEEALPESLRSHFLWSATYAAGWYGDAEALEEYLENPLTEFWNERQHEIAENLRLLAGTDRFDAEAVKGSVREILAEPLTEHDVTVLEALLMRLWRLGDLEGLEAIYEEMAEVSMAPENPISSMSLRLGLLKQLRVARQWQPVHEALRTAVLENVEEAGKAEPPEEWLALREPDWTEWLPIETATPGAVPSGGAQ